VSCDEKTQTRLYLPPLLGSRTAAAEKEHWRLYRLKEGDEIEEVKPRKLRPGDRVVVKAGQIVPGDGEVMQGTASIDESAITAESAPVICEAGGSSELRLRRHACGIGPDRGTDYLWRPNKFP
jgi:hypothetical protein